LRSKTAIMSLNVLKERALKRYRLSSNGATFINGLGFFFGMCFNPLEASVNHIVNKSTHDALMEDRNAIREDFRHVYIKETQCIDAEAE